MKNEQYINIQGWMINELCLKSNTLILYAVIYGFSQDGESVFKGSMNYLCKSLNTSKPTVIKSLKELIDKKLIIKETEVVNSITFNRYKISLPPVKFLYGGGKETLPLSKETLRVGGKETLPGGGKETLPNNTIYNTIDNNNHSNTNKDKETRKLKFSLKHFREVFIDLGCDQEMLEDWIEVKKKKKSPFTRTAAKGIINECNKYNLPVSEAIKICAENGWAGFKYSWYQNLQQQNRTENNLNISEVINSEAAKGFSLKDIK